MTIISTERLSRRYGHRIGIDAVDLEIGEGEIFGFLGPNGAGKTTTIRLLLGLLRPTGGRARICGLDCWKESPRIKRDVGYVPGDLRIYPWMTVRTALKIIGHVRGSDLREQGEDLADRFGLEVNLRVRKMSRGMRQKFGIIMALVHKPRLLVLDEPTSGLDPLTQDELVRCLRERASEGHTVFFSSHTLSEVELLCDRVAIIREGRIVADEALQSMRNRASRVVVITFPNEALAQNIALPDFLTLTERSGRQCSYELAGSTRTLIRWAAEQELEDITIGAPDLESLFRKFYRAPLEVT